jgi:hypothetical protein
MTDIPYWKQRQQMKLKGATRTDRESQEAPEKEPAGEKAPKPPKVAKSPEKKQKKIKRVSKKRAKQERQYKPVRKKFLQQHPICELGYDGCTGQSSEIHHSAGRENDRLLKIDDFKAVCSNCHRIATDKSREAIAAGHSKTRLAKPNRG